jgi:hypothetical protein
LELLQLHCLFTWLAFMREAPTLEAMDFLVSHVPSWSLRSAETGKDLGLDCPFNLLEELDTRLSQYVKMTNIP